MPLFESQEKRNQRLFESWLTVVLSKIEKLPWEHDQRDDEAAWWVAGTAAANVAVSKTPTLSRAWGKGDKVRAASLSVIFTLPMVPRFYRFMPGMMQVPLKDRVDQCETGIWNVVNLYGVPSCVTPDRVLGEYMNIIKQFNHSEDHYDRTGRTQGGFIECEYLVSLALRACGAPSRFSLDGVIFPVDSMSEFFSQGGTSESVEFAEVFVMETMLRVTGASMRNDARSQ